MGPRIAVDLKTGSAKSPVVRAVRPGYRRVPASEYRDSRTGAASAGRQQAFPANLDRIAAAVGSPVIPIDFELADGRRVYLDRGCVKMAERSGRIERLVDGPGGVVEAGRLAASAKVSSSGRCAITGCPVVDVLEAAHIRPHRGEETNHVANGLLLRADLHTLLDRGLLAVDPDGLRVVVAPSIRGSSYGKLHGRALRQRQAGWPKPSAEALRLRFGEFRKRHGT